MHELKKEEMIEVNGGANPVIISAIVAGVVTFVIGLLEGYSNPKKCNN